MTRPMTHRYDNPQLSAIQFLLEVINDPTLLLAVRLTAANSLLKTDNADLAIVRPPDGPPAIIYRFADYQDHKEHHDECAA
jgi:hypothetical protein